MDIYDTSNVIINLSKEILFNILEKNGNKLEIKNILVDNENNFYIYNKKELALYQDI